MELALKIFGGAEFLGGLMVGTQHFHCQSPRFDPWPGNWDPTSCVARPKKKKIFFNKSIEMFFTDWILGLDLFLKFLQFILKLREKMAHMNGNYHYICCVFFLPFHGVSRAHISGVSISPCFLDRSQLLCFNELKDFSSHKADLVLRSLSLMLWLLSSERQTCLLSSPSQILSCLPMKAFLPCLGHSSSWYAHLGSWQPSGIVKLGSWNLKHKFDRCHGYLVLVVFSLKTQTWSNAYDHESWKQEKEHWLLWLWTFFS